MHCIACRGCFVWVTLPWQAGPAWRSSAAVKAGATRLPDAYEAARAAVGDGHATSPRCRPDPADPAQAPPCRVGLHGIDPAFGLEDDQPLLDRATDAFRSRAARLGVASNAHGHR